VLALVVDDVEDEVVGVVLVVDFDVVLEVELLVVVDDPVLVPPIVV
jgi:hypothetical protein